MAANKVAISGRAQKQVQHLDKNLTVQSEEALLNMSEKVPLNMFE